jgi:hypothetical protein
MTSGSNLEKVGLLRSVGGASTVFGPVLKSFRLPLTIPQALHGSGENGAQVSFCRGCLVGSLLGDDVFPCGTMWWMG